MISALQSTCIHDNAVSIAINFTDFIGEVPVAVQFEGTSLNKPTPLFLCSKPGTFADSDLRFLIEDFMLGPLLEHPWDVVSKNLNLIN